MPPRMEATGATRADAPPPENRKAGALLRIGAVLLAIALAFVCAVGVVVMLDIADTTSCEDVRTVADLNDSGECYDGSDTTKTIAMILGWPGSIMAGIAALLALAFAIRGYGGRRLGIAIAIAAVLLGGSLIIG